MRKIVKLSLLGIVACLAAAAPARAVDPVNTGFLGHTAIEGYDPVAYFTEGEPTEGSREHSFEWRGASWRFASAAHRHAFAADPERYAPQYGGYCAYAVALGTTAGIEPQAWEIVDGKLYLNVSLEIQRRWREDIPGYIAKADANWPRLLSE